MTDHKYGPKGHIVDAFLVHLRGMSADDWYKVDAIWDAAGSAARDAWYAAGAAREAEHGEKVERDAAWEAAWEAAGVVTWSAAWHAAWHAVWEIQDADLMRERGQPFYFLPMFGFADEQAVLAALQPKEDK